VTKAATHERNGSGWMRFGAGTVIAVTLRHWPRGERRNDSGWPLLHGFRCGCCAGTGSGGNPGVSQGHCL